MATMPASMCSTILRSPRVEWRFSIQVSRSISFAMRVHLPPWIEPKKTTASLSNKALLTRQSSSSGLLMLAQQRWQPLGFFSGSFRTASLPPQVFPRAVETFPSQA